jgi:hypothetical protein
MVDDAARRALHRRTQINQLLSRFFDELQSSLTGHEEIFERALRQAQAAARLTWAETRNRTTLQKPTTARHKAERASGPIPKFACARSDANFGIQDHS